MKPSTAAGETLESAPGMRLDKWLWTARFYKTRAEAAKACDLGRVSLNGHPAKPARQIRTGDKMQVNAGSGEYEIEVAGLSAGRTSAALAQNLYHESEASRTRRADMAAERKSAQLLAPHPSARPSKRDRRRIVSFKGRG